MATGRLKRWFDERGFGFIAMDDQSGEVFVHISDLAKADIASPLENDRFEFEIVTTERGSKAINIKNLT